jgi:hypothetical protein
MDERERRRVFGGVLALTAFFLAGPGYALASPMDPSDGHLAMIGWSGFTDTPFIIQSITSLLLATGLGALIGFHPMTPRTVDTLEEADLPKIYILYAVIGAVIGVIVERYGTVVGFVVFGLGGLMRFRTNTSSTRDTGRLIIVTLIGLTAGLGLPHFAVIGALFTFALIFLFDAHVSARIVVKNIPEGRVTQAAEAYSAALVGAGCKILSERKSFGKERVCFVFRLPRNVTREELHAKLCSLPSEVRGDLDWEVE